jgi:polar amino acid transport system substrate-binding protein
LWINDLIKSLAKEQFFHQNYAETLAPVYGDAVNPDELVIEGGVMKAQALEQSKISKKGDLS